MFKCLLFRPDDTVEAYVGINPPLATTLPSGTWAYCKERLLDRHSITSPWSQVIAYPSTFKKDWEYYGKDYEIDIPTKYQMIALVHP